MKKIVVTGPESSGKSTLVIELSGALQAGYVKEVARAYIDRLARPYAEPDLVEIAKAQLEEEDQQELVSNGVGRLICDTDLLTIRIWSEEKYGRCDPWIVQQTEERHYDHWLLCKPDILWEPDPQRENPYDRDRLFHRYEALLLQMGKPFSVIEGHQDKRMRAAMAACAPFL